MKKIGFISKCLLVLILDAGGTCNNSLDGMFEDPMSPQLTKKVMKKLKQKKLITEKNMIVYLTPKGKKTAIKWKAFMENYL